MDSEKALINIFKNEQDQTRIVQVTGYLSPGKYKAIDPYGRSWTVTSNTPLKNLGFYLIQGNVVLQSSKPFGPSEEISV